MDTGRAADSETGHRIAVFGHANMEVVITVGRFPVTYEPDRTLPPGAIHVGVSGTAWNVGTALWRLGNRVDLCVSHADDPVGAFVTASQPASPRLRIIPAPIGSQPVTAVLLGSSGERLILNDYRTADDWHHDPGHAASIARGADLVVLPLGRANTRLAARAADFGVPVACDVHAIPGPYGDHEVFCQAADILFMSDERLQVPAADWLEQVMNRWPCTIAILSQGAQGATMAVRGDSSLHHVPAAHTGPVTSTLGAGDALCAGFLDGHTRGLPPRNALQRATIFAAAKLSHIGGSQGHLTATELDYLDADP